MQSFTIDVNDWSRGISMTPRHANGGFSPGLNTDVSIRPFIAKGANLLKEQGAILFPPAVRYDLDANNGDVLVDKVVAFAEDGTFLGNDGYALDEEGNFYTIDGNTVTKRQTDSTNTYADGTCDLMQYKGALYATAREDVVKLAASDLTSIDATWWTSTEGHPGLSSSYRHPMEIVEDTLYIADVEDIHTWDGSASVDTAMSIPNIYNITAMIAHTDGRHLLVFASGTANYSHSLQAKAICYIIDTVNLEFIREIPLHSQVEGAINIGGVIYVTYGERLGYFNGDGITFLRKLNSGTTYKHQMTNYEGTLCVRDKNGILMYGDLGLGNVFWYCYADDQSIPSSPLAIYYAGDEDLLISTASRYLDRIDLMAVDGAGQIYSNRYTFQRDVWIRKIEVESQALASGSDITFSYVDKNDTEVEIMTLDYSIDGAISQKQKFVNIKTNMFKLLTEFAAGNTKGIHSITIWYEDAE